MILASKSPRRSELLSEAGYSFRCVPAGIDERAAHESDPARLVMALARAKAAAVAPEALPGEAVIGSDTVVVLDGRVLGKPSDDADARRTLLALSGRTHRVITAVSVQRDGAELAGFSEEALVTFWPLEPGEVDAYVATGEPRDKAGSYGIQGLGRMLVRRIEGDYYAVVGLPVSRLARVLRGLGVLPDRPAGGSASEAGALS